MIDLHIHSIYSDDGELTPTQLVSRCAEEGISIAAITDHNCIRGCREGEMAGGKHSVKVIPGIEIDCVFEKINFHLLGYGINWMGEDFVRIEENIASQSCHVAIRFPGMEDMIDVIHRNDGMAVLAHPGANLRGKEEKLTDILALGIDGVEVFSSYHTQEQTEYFYNSTKKAGLGMTCGSDFHGKTKPAVKIGQICDKNRWDRDDIEREVCRFLQPCIGLQLKNI